MPALGVGGAGDRSGDQQLEDEEERSLPGALGLRAPALSSALLLECQQGCAKSKEERDISIQGGGKVRHRKLWESQPAQTILISPNTTVPLGKPVPR